jgi:hypothetical protein
MRHLNPDIVCAIALEARDFHAKVEIVDPAPGSNPADDGERGILQDSADDPVGADLRRLIRDLDDDAAAELVAVFWIGRGDYGAGELDDAIAEARRHGRDATPRYLIAQPQLADFLTEGLQALGHDCEDVEGAHF